MADVSSNLKDWSTTASSNSPSGGTTLGAGLDDNLRQIQATARQDLASKGTDVASTATADVGAVAGFMHDITGTTTITSFGTVSAGIHKVIKFEGALTLTHNATSLILPGAANITTADGDIGWFISEGSGNWRCIAFQRARTGPSGKLPVVRVYTSNDTWTKPSGISHVEVTVVGGGAAGGGAAVGNGAGGTGGGGGGTGIKLIAAASLGATETVTVAAAVAGDSDAGSNGNTSAFGTHVTTAAATGGAAGHSTITAGGAGGTASGGDINIPGGQGEGTANDASAMVGGNGGDSHLGQGGPGGSGAGVTGGVYGGGGGGAVAAATNNGGGGAAGVVIVKEFY